MSEKSESGEKPKKRDNAKAKQAFAEKKKRKSDDDFICKTDSHGNPSTPLPIPHNFEVALQKLGVTLGFDEFAQQAMIADFEDRGPELTDADVIALRLKINEAFWFLPGKDLFHDFVTNTARKNGFHPVRDYLDGAQKKWDGVSRLVLFASTYLGVPDTDYTRGVISTWLKAAVRRIRQPGCKFDEMLALIGPQGVEKSTVFHVLAKEERWFTDSLEIGAEPKKVIEETRGTWLAESADLHGYSKRDIDKVKSYASRQIDKARGAWGRLSEAVPRSFIMGATSNNRKFLKDPTGHRRFWPVDVGTIDIAALRRDLDLIWGEVATLEAKPGASIRLPRELWNEAGRVQEEHAEESGFAEILAHKVGVMYWGKLAPHDIYKLCKLDRPDAVFQSHRDAISKAMTKLGWKAQTVSVGGIKLWGYKKDKNADTKFETNGVTYDDDTREWELATVHETTKNKATNGAAKTDEEKLAAARTDGLGAVLGTSDQG